MSAVTVAVVGSRVEAELVVGSLRSHGIHAMVSADDAGGVDLALQAQGVRVLVPEKDLAAARRILGDDSVSSKPLNVLQRWLVRLLGGRER